jgi:hypothetical protein
LKKYILPDQENCVAVAKPYAGDTYGWHAPLLDGTSGGDV